ncbi:hypothetical protein HFO73_01065 [Rhizobium laguerreae]|uniref:hypothetical protein n=1 Tax=Rhizobium laguerreae TaxID=1076926 RepID=UPI001C91C7AA|nr:hypothetical protein [Rhizobium laguerreae]MBY3075845.1 hypothetical protein [Rhizobium laguerreae]
MADSPKSVRFQMMMSEEEAAALDDWAAENKLRSKAEAVRQLCEIGLEASSKADTLEQERLRLLHVKRRGAQKIQGLKRRVLESNDEVEKLRLMNRGLDALAEIFEELVDCSEELAVLTIRAVAPAVAKRIQQESRGALTDGGWLSENEPAKKEEEMRAQLQALQALANRQKGGSDPDRG